MTSINRTLTENITAFEARRREAERAAPMADRLADRITVFAGSMRFVIIHAVLFGVWIAINVGVLPIIPPFDRSLVVLAMVASVEAIFLSTFVLIAQNRMALAAEHRAELDLHISLLSEAELSRLAGLTARIAEKLSVPLTDPEFHEVTRQVNPTEVLDELERRESNRPSA